MPEQSEHTIDIRVPHDDAENPDGVADALVVQLGDNGEVVSIWENGEDPRVVFSNGMYYVRVNQAHIATALCDALGKAPTFQKSQAEIAHSELEEMNR